MRDILNLINNATVTEDEEQEVSIECELDETVDNGPEELEEETHRLKTIKEDYASFMAEAHSPAGKGHVKDMETILNVWKETNAVDPSDLTPPQERWMALFKAMFHAFDASSYHSNTNARGTHGVRGALTDAYQNWLDANSDLPKYAPDELLDSDLLDAEQRNVITAFESLWNASGA